MKKILGNYILIGTKNNFYRIVYQIPLLFIAFIKVYKKS